MRAISEPLLLGGALLGFALGLWQSLLPEFPGGGSMPGDAVARVNGVPIPQAELARALEVIARDKRNPLTEVDRERALENLIAEELLVQQAAAIGLLEADRMVRKTIVDAMLQTVLARSDAEPPSEAELRRFYDDRPMLGWQAARLRLRHAAVAAPGTAFAVSLANSDDPDAIFAARGRSPLPSDWIPEPALKTYLPSSVIDAIAELEPGEVAGPLLINEQAHFVRLIESREAGRPPFEVLRTEVLAAWQRARHESAVAEYLRRLAAAADIERLAAEG